MNYVFEASYKNLQLDEVTLKNGFCTICGVVLSVFGCFISDKCHTNDILCGNNDSSDLPQYCHLLIDYLMIYVLI